MARAGDGLFGSIEERRADEHAGEGEANGVVVREFLLTEPGVEGAEIGLFGGRDGAAVGAVGKVDNGIELLRLGSDQFLAEGGGAIVDGLAKGFEFGGIGVLGGVLPELFEHVHLRERRAADEEEMLPHFVEPGLLGVGEDEAGQMLVFAVEEGEGDDFIHRHDLRVAERGGEHLAVFVEGRFHAAAGGGAVVDDDGHGVGDALIVGRPGAIGGADGGAAGAQAWCGRWERGEDLELDGALGAGDGIERAGDGEFAVGNEVRWESDFDNGGRFGGEIETGETGGVETPFRRRGGG